jgi:putative ABC transport system substrate-binding protein
VLPTLLGKINAIRTFPDLTRRQWTPDGRRHGRECGLAAGRAIDLHIVVVRLDRKNDFNVAFATVVETGASAVMIMGGRFFDDRSYAVVEQAESRDQVLAGGLISYSCNLTQAYGQAGTYAGQILQGIKPFELPVQRSPLKLVVNLKTANGLDLTIPPTLFARADEVIE